MRISSSAVPTLEPDELHRLLDAGARVLLLDVREPQEFDLVKLPGALLVPLMTLPERLEEVRTLTQQNWQARVCYCRSGSRSAMAVEWWAAEGLPEIKNLRGGINAYSAEVDSSLPQY